MPGLAAERRVVVEEQREPDDRVRLVMLGDQHLGVGSLAEQRRSQPRPRRTSPRASAFRIPPVRGSGWRFPLRRWPAGRIMIYAHLIAAVTIAHQHACRFNTTAINLPSLRETPSDEMLRLFSPRYKFTLWRKLWLELAKCQRQSRAYVHHGRRDHEQTRPT